MYFMLNKNHNAEWLLNYKGGAFLFNYDDALLKEAQFRGITLLNIDASQLNGIYQEIDKLEVLEGVVGVYNLYQHFCGPILRGSRPKNYYICLEIS